MDTVTRVQICLLLEKMINNPEYADKIMVENVSKPPEKD